ncbi:PH domain-containing protein [Microbacterium sp. NPDC058345]|uniref:PH domain-containing protein n=1 Tax=Microbacterium sp. NPDC058345 TaxID=3346455 RepID=UPI00364BD19C
MAEHSPATGTATTASPNRGGVALLVVCAVLAVVMLVDAVARAGIGRVLLLAPWLLLVLWAVYVFGVATRIRMRPDGVLVQNLLRRTFVPWHHVVRIDMRWQVEFRLDDGSVLTSLGGPVRRRPQRLGPGRTREDAGGAADDIVAAIRRAKAEAGASGRAGATESADAPVRRSWDLAAILALLALAGWAAAAVIVAYG